MNAEKVCVARPAHLPNWWFGQESLPSGVIQGTSAMNIGRCLMRNKYQYDPYYVLPHLNFSGRVLDVKPLNGSTFHIGHVRVPPVTLNERVTRKEGRAP